MGRRTRATAFHKGFGFKAGLTSLMIHMVAVGAIIAGLMLAKQF